MNAIVIEEHPVDTMTGSQHSLCELQGRQACLTGIGCTMDDDGEFHGLADKRLADTKLADTKKPRHETHARACLASKVLIVASHTQQMQQGSEEVEDTQVERNSRHDVIGFAAIDDTAGVIQDET
jgi:hypothetical protein